MASWLQKLLDFAPSRPKPNDVQFSEVDPGPSDVDGHPSASMAAMEATDFDVVSVVKGVREDLPSRSASPPLRLDDYPTVGSDIDPEISLNDATHVQDCDKDESSNFPQCGQLFSTLQSLDERLKWLSEKSGFVISKVTNSFSESASEKLFHVENGVRVIQRGKYYCNFKDPISRSNSAVRTTCTWNVPFTFDRDNMEYCIKSPCYDHNHNIDDPNVEINGRQTISTVKQLRSSELQLILALSRYKLDVSKIREMLECSNPGRTYSTSLLFRLVAKGKEQFLGKDPHSMTKFMEFGFSIRSAGGVFSFEVSQEQQLEVAFFQTVHMRMYAQQFNDFVIVDGTHNVCMYDLRLLPYTVVCSLGNIYITKLDQRLRLKRCLQDGASLLVTI
jgi:hypothetical protein